MVVHRRRAENIEQNTVTSYLMTWHLWLVETIDTINSRGTLPDLSDHQSLSEKVILLLSYLLGIMEWLVSLFGCCAVSVTVTTASLQWVASLKTQLFPSNLACHVHVYCFSLVHWSIWPTKAKWQNSIIINLSWFSYAQFALDSFVAQLQTTLICSSSISSLIKT